MSEYPVFSPPEDLASKPHRDWTKAEARLYFEWLMATKEARVVSMLEFLGVQGACGDGGRALIKRSSERVVRALRDPACSASRSDGGLGLTSIGYSLAADLGLLVAQQVCRAVGDAVHWDVVSKPRTDASFNLPVLRGGGLDFFDPIEVSIADAAAVLAGRRAADAWVKVFDACIEATAL